MTERLKEPVRSVALQVTEDLVVDGARAMVLVGSYAIGHAGPESDLDILAVGPESYSWRLHRRSGLLVSTSSKTFEGYRGAFALPEEVCAAVPGWRGPVILHDPDGLAATLVREADEWSWGPIERRCNAWVGEGITGYAEEVHKLVSALHTGNRSSAAIQRSLLALHLAPILAVHRRILYGSENRLWDRVSDAMGEEWRRTQSAALGLHGEMFGETCESALKLYGLAAVDTASLMDSRQSEVIGYALAMAGQIRDGRDLL
jgi:hypothetical protein